MINVSNIERFATHDGPGIRTTVFLKGCPLHCPWCANPETWSTDSLLMWDKRKCIGCRKCEEVAKNHSVSWQSGKFEVNQNACSNKEEIAKACMQDALSVNGKWMEEEDIIKEALKDKDYYEESKGGITLSGGEPLTQTKQAIKLLKLAKEAGLHTAIETTGCYGLEVLQEAEPYIDLFLLDMKHLDEDKLKQVVGISKENYQKNITWLSKKRSKDIIIRVPVIPKFNEDILEDIIAYAKELNVKGVNLLPYHSMGKTKWHQLNKEYMYEDEEMMAKEKLKKYESEFVHIGG